MTTCPQGAVGGAVFNWINLQLGERGKSQIANRKIVKRSMKMLKTKQKLLVLAECAHKYPVIKLAKPSKSYAVCVGRNYCRRRKESKWKFQPGYALPRCKAIIGSVCHLHAVCVKVCVCVGVLLCVSVLCKCIVRFVLVHLTFSGARAKTKHVMSTDHTAHTHTQAQANTHAHTATHTPTHTLALPCLSASNRRAAACTRILWRLVFVFPFMRNCVRAAHSHAVGEEGGWQ